MLHCSDGLLCRASRAIVVGRVESSRPGWDANRRHVLTRVTLAVDRWVKTPVGEPPTRIDVVHTGGSLDGRTTYQPGAPRFQVGERVLLFLAGGAPSLGDGSYSVLGLARGKYRIETDVETGRLVAAMDAEGLLFIDPATGRPEAPGLLPSGPGRVDLADLVAELGRMAAGEP